MQIAVYNRYKRSHIFKSKFIRLFEGREAREEADPCSDSLFSFFCIPHSSGLGSFLGPGRSQDPSDTTSILNPGPEAAPRGRGR